MIDRYRTRAGWCLLGVMIGSFPTVTATAQDPPPAQQEREEIITVTATRLPIELAETTAATTVIDRTTLDERPGLGLDEALRWEPAFSLLRRAPARAAHPTAQGLNLRGVGPSGTSRALVLLDGAPMTDAFGGWVYWNRVPDLAIEQVEIVAGGGSAPWGSAALAGALQIVAARPPRSPRFAARLGAATQSSTELGLLGGFGIGTMRALVATQLLRTAGYIAVAPDARGPIDTEVGQRYASTLARLAAGETFLVSFDGLVEDRDNGTPERTNDTLAGGATVSMGSATGAATGGWQAAAFARWQRFDSRFTAVSDSRTSEFPTLDQRVESSDFGVRGHTWGAAGSGLLSAGGDFRAVSGTSHETVLASGFQRDPGGRQQLGGGFAAVSLQPGEATAVELTVRGDGWRNVAHGAPEEARTRGFFSPRAAARFDLSPTVQVRASAYGSFRAPTLNELYRQFRVGDVVTLANDELVHERLRGVEAGVGWSDVVGSARVEIRADAYTNRLDDAIINATIDSSGPLIRRQRRNVGRADIRGIELKADVRWDRWQLTGAGAWMRSRFRTLPGAGESDIVGNRLPQVPGYRLRLSARYLGPSGWSALVGVLATGQQYEDDLNDLSLAAGASLEASVRVPLAEGFAASLQAQNLLDQRLETGRTPELTLGPPPTLILTLDWRPR